MLFKAIDKFFHEIKYVLSIVTFFLIAMASLFFIYWLLFSAKLVLPGWLNVFVWGVIDFWAQGFKNTPLYKEITAILPVLTSGVFIILTYFVNCLMLFIENNHKRFTVCVENYKTTLAKTINQELHNDFIAELKKTTFMMLKIKVVIKKHTSYLTALTDVDFDEKELETKIHKQILTNVSSDIILDKGLENNSVYFVITDFQRAKEFLGQVVTVSSRLIGNEMRPKLDIGFYCGVELYNELSEFERIKTYLDKMLDLKITNKISVTPRFKVYFDNIHPSQFVFDVMGEYNLSENPDSMKNVEIYSLRRK